MSLTLTSIANQALIAIDKDPIKSLEVIPGNPNASSPVEKSGAIINVVLDQTIRWVQSKSRWSDLYQEADLSLVSEPTETNAAYVYAYPSDVLGYVQLISGAPYEVRAKRLHTTDPAARLRYIRFSREPSEWNPFLTEAIIAELAARIAPKLNSEQGVIQLARQKADQALVDNVASDYTNRATPRERGSFFGLNQAREGLDSRYPGWGRSNRLRNEAIPRYPSA